MTLMLGAPALEVPYCDGTRNVRLDGRVNERGLTEITLSLKAPAYAVGNKRSRHWYRVYSDGDGELFIKRGGQEIYLSSDVLEIIEKVRANRAQS